MLPFTQEDRQFYLEWFATCCWREWRSINGITL